MAHIWNVLGQNINPLTDEKFPLAMIRTLYNFTTTPLGASETWTGVGSTGALYHKRVMGTCKSDQSGTLYVEQSADSSNWDFISSFTVTGGTGIGFEVTLIAQYCRMRYVNGATPQTYFRLYGYYDPR